MAVEVTARDRDTHQRDRVDKPDGYAAADIPVHLLVDRDRAKAVVCTEPAEGEYHSVRVYSYGDPIELPAPVGFTLETDELKELTA